MIREDDMQQAVYDAEEVWRDDADMLGLYNPDEPTMTPGEIDDFIASVFRKAEWPQSNPPVVVFDVRDDDRFSGMVTGADEVIHLHPRLLSRTNVLHEVAHWLDLRGGHGPIFQANLITLYDAEFGTEAAVLLYECFTEKGLIPDPWRLPESMPATKRLQAASLERSRAASTGGGRPMSRTQEALAASIRARAGSPDPDKPGLSDPGLRGRVALTILRCMVEGAPPESALMVTAAGLPVHDGQSVLGQEAAAVLDGIFSGQVDTATMFETFTAAIEADLFVMDGANPGTPR